MATAIVAVAFQPVRERLQKVANRLVYGKRATPYEVLSQFSERVAESYAADDVLPRMARVLADGTGAARADVWLRAGDFLRQAATWPADSGVTEPALIVGDALPQLPEADRAVEVRHQGELLGALTVTKRKGESLTPVEEKLLTDLAGQAGLVLKNVGLTAELLARLEDLRASRQRLVAAQDEERRRLERNLHDGAQQNLVALKVKLGLAEMFAEKDPARAKQTLAELKVDTDEALETLRDLARGIYPPLLADKGLVAALESQARKATLPVQVDADGVGRYPQDVEAAVYFCCLEALQNVQKYAAAQSAVVKLDGSESGLTFEVTDDGQGFDGASVKRGAGLTNMTDRIDALGLGAMLASEVHRQAALHCGQQLEAVRSAKMRSMSLMVVRLFDIEHQVLARPSRSRCQTGTPEDGRLHLRGRGSVQLDPERASALTAVSNPMSPPIDSTILFVSARPSPVPAVRVSARRRAVRTARTPADSVPESPVRHLTQQRCTRSAPEARAEMMTLIRFPCTSLPFDSRLRNAHIPPAATRFVTSPSPAADFPLLPSFAQRRYGRAHRFAR